ncbi:MAG: HAMP domain-containing sensor histidine kinase [Methylococcales bacterium]|nr:HAMP domain-containing sensor histidine kinase [Methylococcales bacterium]
MAEKKILIIDDNDDFVLSLKQQAQLGDNPQRYLICQLTQPDILDVIREQAYAIQSVFMDYDMGEHTAERVMEALSPYLNWNKVRVFWFSGDEALNTLALLQARKHYPTLSPEFLRKPFLLADLESLVSADFKLARQWLNFPKPLRVINKQGHVVYTNEHWLGASNSPAPGNFINLRGFITDEHSYFKERPDSANSEAGYFHLCSFASDDGDYLLQYAIPETADVSGNKWQGLVEKMAAALQEMGYTRIRFCRYLNVPNGVVGYELSQDNDLSQGVLALSWSSTKLNEINDEGEQKASIREPLTGDLLKRIREMVAQYRSDKETSKLSYRIATQPDCNDPWRNLLIPPGAEDYCVVELPLFSEHKKVLSVIGNPGLLGMLMFDRYDATQNRFLPITAEDIGKLEKTLLQFCFELIKSMESDILKTQQDNMLAYAELDEEMAGGFATSNALLKKLLQHAVEDVGAISGYITERHYSGYEVTIDWLENKSSGIWLFQHAIYTEHAFCLPAVQCWRQGKTIAFPATGQNQADRKNGVVEAYNDPDQVLYIGDKTDIDIRERWSDYLQNNVRSIVALPVFVNNEQIAAIVLHADTDYHFDYERLERLKILTYRAGWLLTVARHIDDRKLFLDGVMHEINTNLNPLAHFLRHLEVTEASRAGLIRCQHSVRRLEMASRNLLLLTATNNAKGIYIDPPIACGELATVLQELAVIYGSVMDDRGLSLVFHPPLNTPIWETKLPMSREWLMHVCANILDNAVKASRRSTITVLAENSLDMFSLSLSNSGHLSPQQCIQAFDQHYYSLEGQGFHVGLASCRQLMGLHRGSIDLTSSLESGQITATLSWPLGATP